MALFLANPAILTTLFFTDHLKQKIVNKTTCGTPSANPCQLCAQ